MEREYQLFCDRCGQRLNWSGFDNCEVRHIGWDGPENEEESDANSKQPFYFSYISSAYFTAFFSP